MQISLMTKNNLIFFEPIVLDLAGIAQAILKYDWSPIIFDKSIRSSKHYKLSDFAVLDFDHGLTLQIALQLFSQYQHIIATTRNHQVEKNGIKCDRFRVVLPFENSIEIAENYKFSVKHLIKKYKSDPACSDCGRFFFKSVEIVSIKDTGYKQLTRTPPVKFEQPKHPKKEKLDYANLAKLKRFLDTPIPVGQRNRLCFWVVKRFIELNFEDSAMYNIIKSSAAFNNFPEKEIFQTIQNARKY